MRVMHHRPYPVRFEVGQDVGHARIADVGYVLLEGQTEDRDAGAVERDACADHQADQLLRDEAPHAVIDPTSGQDDLGVVADGHGLLGQVIGVNADTMPAHETGREVQEVPLGACRCQHIPRGDVDPLEDQGELVHQGDVEIPLGVLDHLGGLGHLDRGRDMQACLDDFAVGLGEARQGGGVLSRDHFRDALQTMRLVAGIDPFGE